MFDDHLLKKVRHGLLPERRRDRFTRELAAHAEDAGTTERLGDPVVLRETFHTATHARRTLIVGILFALLVCWCTFAALNFDETPYEQNPFIGYSMLVGFIFIVPISPFLLFLIVFPLYHVFTDIFDVYFLVLPFFTTFFYTSIYFLWNYGSPKSLEWTRPKPPRTPIVS